MITGAAFDLFDESFFASAAPGGRILRDFDVAPFFSADDFVGADSGDAFDADFFGDVCCRSFSRFATSRNFFFVSFHGDESIPLVLN